MNCRICGRVTPPGAKLCPDCRAARKRAFDATVTQPLLAAVGASRSPRSSTRLLRPSPRPSPPPAVSVSQVHSEGAARAKWPLLVAALAILLLAGGYLTQRLVGSKKPDAAAERAAEESPRQQTPARAPRTDGE